MRFLKLHLAILIMATGLAASAASPEGFETGNTLYAQGKFKEARQAYESVVQSGNYSAILFYNLANAEFRLGDVGQAALNYERAIALNPNLPEARANLSYVRNQTGAKTRPASMLSYFFVDLSANAYAWVASLAGWFGLFCLSAAFFKKQRQGLITAALFAAIVCAYSIAATQFLLKENSFAVVTAKRADARFAPMDSATLVEPLPAGSHLRILTKSGSWAYCDLPNGTRAWVPEASIEPILPPKV